MSNVVADEIDVNFRTGMVNVMAQQNVNVTHRAMSLDLAGLEYHFATGDITQLRHLKTSGKGRITALDAGMPFKSFSWKDKLWITPQSDANKYKLWLLGAKAILPDDGVIQTDSLSVGFALPQKDPAAAPVASKPDLAERRVIPEVLLAEGNVLFDTADLYAETDQLKLFINQVNEQTPQKQRLRLQDASGNSMRLWTREPAGGGASNGFAVVSAAGENRASRPRPRIAGKLLSASVLTDGSSAIANGFLLNEKVRIEHVLETETGPLPVVLTGEELRFAEDKSGRRLQISGQPAQAEIADGLFRGPVVTIQLDENFLFMDQAGDFRAPMNLLSSFQDGPQKFRWLSAPTCSWQGNMRFNGQTAQLIRGVKLTGAVATLDEPSRWDLHVGCDLLEIQLNQRVDFDNPQSTQDNSVNTLTFKGLPEFTQMVTLSAVQRDGVNKLLGSHQMQVPEISITPGDGKLYGPGPGWYHMWSKPDGVSYGPVASMGQSGAWQAAHLVFEEAMHGDFNTRVLSFLRGVRIATSPVASAETRIDALQIVDPLRGQAVVACDALKLSQTPVAHQYGQRGRSNGTWEAEAIDNVSFATRNENNLLTGTASRAGYAADKDLFVIVGSANRPARFQQTYADGQPGPSAEVLEFAFRPKSMEFVNVKIGGGGANTGELDRLQAEMQSQRERKSQSIENPARPTPGGYIPAEPRRGLSMPLRGVPQANSSSNSIYQNR